MRKTVIRVVSGLILTSCALATELVNDKVDWPAFLARQDLVWEVLPTESPHDVSFFKALGQLPVKGDSGAFLGNGMLGAVVFQKNTNTFCWGMGRSDVTERRRDNGRLAVGDLYLTTVGKIQSGTMRLDLWNAEARGEIVTDKGGIKFRSLVHADRMVMFLDIETTGGESGAKFAWNPSTGQMTRGLAGPFLKKDPPNPAGAASVKDGVTVYTQPRIAGGEFAGGWKEVASGNTRRVYVSVTDSFPGNTATQEAVETVKKAASSDYAGLIESHRNWWHALYLKSFVSFPDPKLESFYWIQIYKLASASRPGRGPVDEAGPWYRDQKEGFYSRIWWNLNIQIVNAPAYTANQLELAEPLIQLLDEHRDNFFEQGKKLWNCPEGASVSHTSDREGRRGDGHLSHNSFLNPGDFTWALQNYYLHYRYSMDHAMVTNQEQHAFYPLLRGTANVYLHLAKPGPDGKLHLPKLHSPEFGNDTDTSYNLSLMRWALQTLIALNQRYQLNDPLLPKWQEALANLTPWPVDENGYRVGATMGFTKAHRHWSHLFMVHPLHILDLDDQVNRELFKKSLDHWAKLGTTTDGWDRIEDWSFSSASALYAALGDGDRALDFLHRHINTRTICRNTMSLGPWLSIEGAITVNRSVQELLLQSHGNLIRVFPAVPAGWTNAVFHNLRAEGAFLVSAERQDGKTRWVRVKSLAGEPCRILWEGKVKELPLAKDEETLLYVSEKPQPVVQPVVADPVTINAWGLKLADLAKPAPVAQVGPKPKPVSAAAPEADNTNAQTELADKQRNVAKKGNLHPDAQWFPKAGLGLFMHWGIHSVAGVQPSWAIFESYGKKPSAEYIALAGKFDPQNYDPDKWFASAAKAGFKYVVLTAKHADGYELWPSEYGNFHSQRDLLKPYVEAARKHGLKVGFYYSPSDWTFNPEGWPYMGYPRRDGLKEHALKFGELDPVEVQKRFETIYAYVKGQLTELLTRYGTIDLLWLDGFDWPGTLNDHGPETLAYLRTLQPGLVINDRWYLWPKPRTLGDYQTFEQTPPCARPAGWWEFCQTIKGHWGYSPTHKIRPTEDVITQLAKARAWGGNYLPNIGPAPDGTLHEDVYKFFDEMAAWMKHSGEAVGDVQPMPASVRCNVPVTVKDDKTWYFFATNEIVKIEATGVNEPAEAVLLRTGDKIKFARMNGTLELTLPAENATRSVNVVKVRWK